MPSIRAGLMALTGVALAAFGASAQTTAAAAAKHAFTTMFIGTPIPGSDPNGLQATLGRGYNTFTSTTLGNCVAARFFEPTMQGAETTAHIRVIKSADELQRDTSLNVSASSSFGSVSVSGSSSFSNSISISTSSDYLLVQVVVTGTPVTAADEKLAELASSNKADDHKFFQACGNRFVSGVRLGGEFSALFQFTSSSETERTKVQVSLKAASALTSVSGDLTTALETASQHSDLNVSISGKGPKGVLPDTSLADILAFARAFPSEVTKDTAVPIELILSDYKTVDPSIRSYDESADVRHLRQLIDQVDASVGQLKYLKEAYQRLAIPRVNEMASIQSGLEARLGPLREKLGSCGLAPWDACQIPPNLISFDPPKLPPLPIETILTSKTGDYQLVGTVESGDTCNLRITGRFKYKGGSDATADAAGQSLYLTRDGNGVQSEPKAYTPSTSITGPAAVLVRIWDSDYGDNEDVGEILATLY